MLHCNRLSILVPNCTRFYMLCFHVGPDIDGSCLLYKHQTSLMPNVLMHIALAVTVDLLLLYIYDI